MHTRRWPCIYKRTQQIGLLLCFILLAASSSARAQNIRPEDTFFIKPRAGISNYLGDNEKSPTNFNFDLLKIDGKLPYNVGLELGYQFSVPFSISGGYQLSNNPIITQFGNEEGSERGINHDPTIRHTVQLLGRYTFANARSRVAPYLDFGGAFSFGDVRQADGTNEQGSAFGPLVGLGLDVAVNDRTSFFVEAVSSFSLSDAQLDANANNGFGGTDILTGMGMGVKINFERAFTAVEVFSVTCPNQALIVGQNGNFTAAVNDDIASQPVEYRWDFGDGATATGLGTAHSYTEAGSYTVTLTATNSGSTDSATCSVRVIAPAEILTITADKRTISICDPDPSVTFSANTRGDAPMTYAWNFGDDNTSSDANPTHTYADTGTYTVSLTLTNEGGTDTRTMTVTVNDVGCFDCDVTQMASVFFDRNESTLDAEDRRRLDDNLEVFLNCANINGRLEGYASRDEENPQALSEDRARTVEQYYIDNGIAASRFTVVGNGATGQTTKKGGAEQFRRVDTIPVSSVLIESETGNGDRP